MEFEFMNNKMPYDLQRYVQEFFEKKLPFIMSRSRIQYDEEKYLMNDKTGENVGQQIQFLMKLEKIFHSTHLTYGTFSFIIQESIIFTPTLYKDTKIQFTSFQLILLHKTKRKD